MVFKDLTVIFIRGILQAQAFRIEPTRDIVTELQLIVLTQRSRCDFSFDNAQFCHRVTPGLITAESHIAA